MFRIAPVAIVLFVIALAPACNEGERSPPGSGTPLPSPTATVIVRVTPPPRPTAVPETSRPIEQTTTLGRITRRAEEEPQTVALRDLISGTCQDDVMTLRTSEETIYAALLCERFSQDQFDELFAGQQVAIVLEVTEERFRVLIDTLGGAQAEFTVDGIWVE